MEISEKLIRYLCWWCVAHTTHRRVMIRRKKTTSTTETNSDMLYGTSPCGRRHLTRQQKVGHEGQCEESKATLDRPWADERVLTELYVEDDLSIREVASELGCTFESVRKNINRMEIGDDT